MIAVIAPATAPAIKAHTKTINTGWFELNITAVTAPPKVNEPSVVISGILNIRIEIKIPIASDENPNPSSTAVK